MSKPTIKSLTETLAIAQAEIERLHGCLKAQAARAILAEEELLNLKDQLEEKEVQQANRTSTQSGWKGLSGQQLDWLKGQGCTFQKTATGFKLFLKGDALTHQSKISAHLKGKVCKDNNNTWIYFS